MQLAYREPNAKYITLNMPQELYIPQEIAEKSVGIAGDIAQSLKELNTNGWTRTLQNNRKGRESIPLFRPNPFAGYSPGNG